MARRTEFKFSDEQKIKEIIGGELYHQIGNELDKWVVSLPWAAEEIAIIRMCYGKMPVDVIVEKFLPSRTHATVQRMASILGYTRKAKERATIKRVLSGEIKIPKVEGELKRRIDEQIGKYYAHRDWSISELAVLVRAYGKMPIEVIIREFLPHRTRAGVHSAAAKLGLRSEAKHWKKSGMVDGKR